MLTLPASKTVTLPRREAEQMWQPRRESQRVTELSFLAFCMARRVPYDRPRPAGIAESTAKHYERLVCQVLRETGHMAPAKGERRPPLEAPPQAWEISPPWEDVYDWSKGGHASLEGHRKAFVWYGSLWGQNGDDLPRWMRQTWATEDDVHEARNAGEMTVREPFLNLPTDIETLLAARPYTDKLQAGRLAGSRKLAREARYLDDMWRTIIFLGFYLGARPGEFADLAMQNIDDARGITGWSQRKKRGKPRSASVPETWIYHDNGRNAPSLNWYLTRVRTRAEGGHDPTGPVFLRWRGGPYTNDSMRDFIAEGMRRALNKNRGGHSLRRACATWRYQHGWTLEAIAHLLGDTERVISETYIDYDWIHARGDRTHNTRTATPNVPLLRSNGRRADKPREEKRTVPPFSSGQVDGPAGKHSAPLTRISERPPKKSGSSKSGTQPEPAEDAAGSPPFFTSPHREVSA